MAQFDCRKCRQWKGCPGKEWYSYSEIRWCAQQVFWLLKYDEIVRGRQWPVPDSTAIGGMRGESPNTEAAFAKIALVIAEVDQRLDKTGWRGRLLREEAKNREKMIYLSDDAKDALYYVAGWNPKDRDFSAWRKDRKYHKKATKMSQNCDLTGPKTS